MQKGSIASPPFAILTLAVATILLKIPTLGTPAYWDEMGWMIPVQPLSEGSLIRALPGFRPAAEFMGHPPGLQLILAMIGRVVGVSMITAHVLIAFFAAVGVCATFLLARHWYGVGAAWLAGLLLLLSPIYLAQAGMFLADLPVAALGVLSTYFVVKDRYLPYLLCASCMVLLKETAIVIVIALVVYRFVVLNSFRKATFRDVSRYCLPLAVIGAFIVLQKVATGQFVFIYDFDVELFQLTPEVVLEQFGLINKWIFIDQYRFIFTVLIAVNLLINPKSHRRELWLFVFLVVLSGYSFAVLYYLPRYLLPILPVFYILGAVSLLELARRPGRQLVAAGAVLGVMTWSLTTARLIGNGETSGRYRDVIAMNKAVIDSISSGHRGARVLTIWPLAEQLTRPILGYVKEPLRVQNFETDSSVTEADVILVSQPANGPEVRLREVAQDDAWQLVLQKKNESAWIEVYTRNPVTALPSR